MARPPRTVFPGHAVASLLLPLLAACVAIEAPAPDLASREITPRERFSADQAAVPHVPVENDWVATLGDPALSGLVEEAILANPDLRQAAAALDEARARSLSASSYLWPQLSGNGTAQRARPLFFGGGGLVTASRYTVAVQASWELDTWGRLRSASASAETLAEAQRLDLAAARQSLAAAVADAWLLSLQARASLAIDDELLTAETRTAEVTRDKVEAGVGAQLEAELAEANVRLATATVQADQAALQDLTRALEVLLGRYPAAELELADGLPPFPGEIAVGVPSEILARRPDLVAADRRVAAAFHRTESARAARLPSLTLSGSVGSTLHPALRIWSIGTNLVAPLFTGGRIKADIAIANAQQQQVLSQYVATALDAFREVEGALANEGFLALRETELSAATTRLQNASRVGSDRYDAGILSIVDLITIRRQDFQSRRELLQVRTSRLRQRVALHLALGGSFDREASTTTPEPPIPQDADHAESSPQDTPPTHD